MPLEGETNLEQMETKYFDYIASFGQIFGGSYRALTQSEFLCDHHCEGKMIHYLNILCIGNLIEKVRERKCETLVSA